MKKRPLPLLHLCLLGFFTGCQSGYVGEAPVDLESNEAFFDDIRDYAVDTMVVLSADEGTASEDEDDADAGDDPNPSLLVAPLIFAPTYHSFGVNAVVATGETALYANIILKKGVVI